MWIWSWMPMWAQRASLLLAAVVGAVAVCAGNAAEILAGVALICLSLFAAISTSFCGRVKDAQWLAQAAASAAVAAGAALLGTVLVAGGVVLAVLGFGLLVLSLVTD